MGVACGTATTRMTGNSKFIKERYEKLEVENDEIPKTY